MSRKKNKKRFWRWGTSKMDAPDILYCAGVLGILILSMGGMILFAPLDTPFGSEKTNLSNSTDQNDTATQVETQPEDPASRDTTDDMDPGFEAELQRLSDKLRKIEQQYLSNELRKEYLDTKEASIDWWMGLITVILGFFAVAVTIFGFVSFREFRRLRDEAMKNVSEIKEIWDVAHMVQDRVEQAMQNAKGELDAEAVAKLYGDLQFEEALHYMQQLPYFSSIDRSIINACQLQLRGEIMKAIQTWHSVVKMAEQIDVEQADSDDIAVAWSSIGFLYLERGNTNRALSAFDKAIELRPGYAGAYVGRGNVKLLLGQREDAIADYEDAIGLGADFAENYSRLADVKNALGRHEEAIADCETAIRKNPNYILAYMVRGEAKNGLGNISSEEIRADFQQALQLATWQRLEHLRAIIEQRLQELS